eukprot:SAG31_NODE_538_length_14312_cov_12.542461_3_plen_97_part_00
MTTLGFAVALLCVGCVPIDIYAVSNAEALADEVAAVGASKPASVTNFVRLLYEGEFTPQSSVENPRSSEIWAHNLSRLWARRAEFETVQGSSSRFW